jgi:hypothetical protein
MNQPLPMLFGAMDRNWYSSVPKQHWYHYIMVCRVLNEVTISADELRVRKEELAQTLFQHRHDPDYPQLHPMGFLGMYVTEGAQYYLVVCNDIGQEATQRIMQEILQKQKPGELAFSYISEIQDRHGKTLEAYASEAERKGRQLLYLAAMHFGVMIELSHNAIAPKRELVAYRQRVHYTLCYPEANPTILTRCNFPSHDTFHWFCVPVETLTRDYRVVMKDSMAKGLIILDASQASQNRQYIPIMTGMKGIYVLRPGQNMVYSVLEDDPKSATQLMSRLNLGKGGGGSYAEPYVPDYEPFIQESYSDLPMLFRLMPVAVIVRPARSQEVMTATSSYIDQYLKQQVMYTSPPSWSL